MISVLNTVGEAFDITDLKGTRWTDPDGKIKEPFRTGGRLRAIFYGTGYQQHTGALLTRAHDKKQSLAASLRANPMFVQQSFYCPGVPGEIRHTCPSTVTVCRPTTSNPWHGIGTSSGAGASTPSEQDGIPTSTTFRRSAQRATGRRARMDEAGARVKYDPQTESGFKGRPDRAWPSLGRQDAEDADGSVTDDGQGSRREEGPPPR